MNEKIRFWVWDKINKVMRHVITRIDWLIDGRPIRVYWCTSEIEDGVITGDESDDFGFILFQSTGLHDSTRTEEFPEGKEIWEGSILRIKTSGAPKLKLGVVFWNKERGMWAVRSRYQSSGSGPLSSWYILKVPLTVIGDTMQNPKMMEVKK